MSAIAERLRPFISALSAFLVLWFAATARAEPVLPSNIPAAQPETSAVVPDGGARTLGSDASAPASSEGIANDELPLPYTPWNGRRVAPPKPDRTRGLPLPMARPREQPRRPFEISAGLAAFLPSCGSGSIDDRACLTLSAGTGVELSLLYRPSPFFAFGGEAALSGFGNGHGMLSSSGGGARFLGVTGRVYFADQGPWDPYVALTLGAGVLSLRGDEASKVATSGLGAKVSGGIDYQFGSRVRLGPSAAFSRWVAYEDASCERDICRDGGVLYGHVLGFASLGLRLSGSFGDTL